MDPKLTMLFMLIGVVVGLSHLSERRRGEGQPPRRSWRRFANRPRLGRALLLPASRLLPRAWAFLAHR